MSTYKTWCMQVAYMSQHAGRVMQDWCTPVAVLTCGFIWLFMFPGKFAGPEFLTLCLPIMAAPCSPKTQRQVRPKLVRAISGVTCWSWQTRGSSLGLHGDVGGQAAHVL